MSLSSNMTTDTGDWDTATTITFEYMLGVDQIPDTMNLVCGDTTIVLK